MEKIDHPKHYNSHPSGIECIDIARHYCFDIGNAIKYLWRAGLKSEEGYTDNQKEIEDLNKAIWYIQDRINQLQANKKETIPLPRINVDYMYPAHKYIETELGKQIKAISTELVESLTKQITPNKQTL